MTITTPPWGLFVDGKLVYWFDTPERARDYAQFYGLQNFSVELIE
ncbi:MAG: hypothetical protein K0Q50_215 [Vampirovibrio sp.]|jgi:hypothetical protein|nr:hypothetical protein [Vampirovibrio sp.]